MILLFFFKDWSHVPLGQILKPSVEDPKQVSTPL